MTDILIVDGSAPVRWTLAALLRARGYKVEQASDGQQALSHFYRHRFDLVLMDVYMPVMSGFDACQELRQQSEVPILMLSSIPDPSIKQRAMDCGATAFIPKPLNIEGLLSWINSAISNNGAMANGTLGQAIGAC